MTMQVNWVVRHGQVAKANAHLIVFAYDQWVNAREDAAVPAPDVEVQHGHYFRCVRAGVYVIGIEQKHKVPVHFINQRVLVLGMGDPKTHHAHRHLRHLIGVRVVHEGARAASYKLVNKGFTHRNGGLVQTRYAVHAVRQALAVPMNAGVFGQLIRDKNAYPVALHDFNRRAR